MKQIYRISILFVALLSVVASALHAQVQTVIAPEMSGDSLRQYVVEHYKTYNTLGYDDARDTLYLRIDRHDGDQLTGVYSGYTITMDTTVAPRTDAYYKGINAEHTWPQSQGAGDEPQRSDMHNLFPCRDIVNSSRKNYPFDDIPDYQTDSWYWHDEVIHHIPADHIDEYSELENDTDTFEPREDHKGNVARAIFYFYTMYQTAASESFFNREKSVMLGWEDLDPVDSLEYARTWKIAAYQDDKPNPFVLDSTLARRMWFTGVQDTTPPDTGKSDFDGLIISEVMDGNRSGGLPKYVEVYNASISAIDMNGIILRRASNGATNYNNAYTFPDISLLSGQAYVISYESEAFDAVYSAEARDFTTSSVSGNGNDVYALFSPGDTLIDIFGTPGTQEYWYENSYAERISSVNHGSAVYDKAEWSITSLPGGHPLDGNPDMEGTPGTHTVDQPLRIENAPNLPLGYSLSQAYPNPFNNATTVEFNIPKDGRVLIRIYDLRGRLIDTPVNQALNQGNHIVHLNFADRPSGVYLVRFASGRFTETRKLLLLK